MIKAQCIYCGKDFDKERKEHVYCSKHCFYEHRKIVTKTKDLPKVKCKECGKLFEVPKYETKSRKFCSHKCYHINKKKHAPTGENNIFWKGGLITKNCEVCGKGFKVKRYLHERGQGRFCSMKCRGISMKGKNCGESNPNYNSKKIKCEICGKEFSRPISQLENRNHVCCSNECYWELRSKVFVGKNHSNWKERVKINCDGCGKEIEITQYEMNASKTHFCNKDCFIKYYKGEMHHCWKGGLSINPYCEKFNKEFKNRVRTFFEHRCVVCGKTMEENGNRLLDVHHVDYNKDACCNGNNRLFVILCSSCHMKTNFNREYWKEYFIKLIESDYEGKCYYTKEEYKELFKL